MKASVSPAVVILAGFALSCAASCALGQDVVVQKDGQRREGQILAVKPDAIRMKIGPAETGIPMANVASVTMPPPKAYDEAVAAWQKGDAAKALSLLSPLTETFGGLPTPWASRACALLGEAYLAANQTDKAEAAFARFQKLYPDAAGAADVGLAALAIAKNDFGGARVKLVPIVDKAKSTKLADPADSALYGQALYLLGVVQEASDEKSEALENYLLAVTIFHDDQSVVAKAAERANALQQKSVIVP